MKQRAAKQQPKGQPATRSTLSRLASKALSFVKSFPSPPRGRGIHKRPSAPALLHVEVEDLSPSSQSSQSSDSPADAEVVAAARREAAAAAKLRKREAAARREANQLAEYGGIGLGSDRRPPPPDSQRARQESVLLRDMVVLRTPGPEKVDASPLSPPSEPESVAAEPVTAPVINRRPRNKDSEVELGTRIRLEGSGEIVTVENYDRVGGLHLVRGASGKPRYEVLQGKAAHRWSIVEPEPELPAECAECSEDADSPEPPGSSSTVTRTDPRLTRGDSLKQRQSEIVAGLHMNSGCPICYEPHDAALSRRMPCCDRQVHAHCIARWRRSNASCNSTARGSRANPSDFSVPNTRICPFCRAEPEDGGCTSTRRIFGEFGDGLAH
jgi:hypothetical protein